LHRPTAHGPCRISPSGPGPLFLVFEHRSHLKGPQWLPFTANYPAGETGSQNHPGQASVPGDKLTSSSVKSGNLNIIKMSGRMQSGQKLRIWFGEGKRGEALGHGVVLGILIDSAQHSESTAFTLSYRPPQQTLNLVSLTQLQGRDKNVTRFRQ
jgi:hypothetical protein